MVQALLKTELSAELIYPSPTKMCVLGMLHNYMEYPFIAITPRSTQTWSSSICQIPIFGSNRSV